MRAVRGDKKRDDNCCLYVVVPLLISHDRVSEAVNITVPRD